MLTETILVIKFALKLLEKLPRHDKVYFSNSGSEANEKAYKLVRQASRISSLSAKARLKSCTGTVTITERPPGR